MVFEFESDWGTIQIGDGLPPHLIAEIGLNHNGSIALAKKLIAAAAESGAHSVKFQKRSPQDLATADTLNSPFAKAPYLGATQAAVRSRLEFSPEQYSELLDYANSLGLVFFASVFDIPSLQVVVDLGIRLIKVASHSITNGPLLEAISKTDLSVIASTGGATAFEVQQALSLLEPRPVMLMHCVSSYPTADSDMRLDSIASLAEEHGRVIGFSSHETGIVGSIAAAAIGAAAIERHFTLSSGMAGLDQSISLGPSEFAELSRSLRRLHSMRGSRDGILASESPSRSGYHVSLCASRRLNRGEIVKADDVVALQPLRNTELFFGGLDGANLIGKRLLADVEEQAPFRRDQVAR